MKVDHVLILAAGKGTRMGSIGELLPKVIWPIFNKSILELEVCYAKRYAPDANIFINLFNFKDIIKDFINKNIKYFEGVTVIEEAKEIDIGGAIHNMAKEVNYSGNLLIINSDQFLFSEQKIVELGLEKLQTADSVLFTYEVNQRDGYSTLDIRGDELKGIVANSELSKGSRAQTYTGMSLIRLEKLEEFQGKSSFFKTIANPKNNLVKTIEISGLEYWDFGTVNRYHESMFKTLSQTTSSFYNFLRKTKSIDIEKNFGQSYGGDAGINLTNESQSIGSLEILLESADSNDRDKNLKNIILGKRVVTAN